MAQTRNVKENCLPSDMKSHGDTARRIITASRLSKLKEACSETKNISTAWFSLTGKSR
jgi:hypothetical protein